MELPNFKDITIEKLENIAERIVIQMIEYNNEIANLDKNLLSFENCFENDFKLDSQHKLENVLLELQQLHPNKECRNKMSELGVCIGQISIEQNMRKDVFQTIKHYYNNQYQEEKNKLTDEQNKYVEKAMKAYKMLGLDLIDEQYERVKLINKRLTELSTTFHKNISECNKEFLLTKEDLEGMDNEWLENRKVDHQLETYKVQLSYPDYVPIMEYCKNRETRKLMNEEFGGRCTDTNLTILDETLKLRKERAEIFGFNCHSDYKLQDMMAQNSNNVFSFLNNLMDKIKPILTNDLDELYKIANDIDHLESWDFLYYTRKYTDKESSLDKKELSKYFTIETVTKGMFEIYETLLGLKFVEVTDQYPNALYAENIQLFYVYNYDDLEKPIGCFYFDLFPREGKYSHAAQFTLIPKSDYNLPLCAIVCNFDPKLNIEFNNVVTFFHEFGHLMHNITSENSIASLAGTHCQRDFVETPSQMFEEWCYCLEPLKKLSNDPDAITDDLLQKINKSNKLLQGVFNARQLSFCFLDMKLHSNNPELGSFYNDLIKDIFKYDISPKINMTANWGHLFGYDSLYYGYQWSKVYAIDLFSFFKDNELNQELGLKLRKEILSKGGAYDGNVLLRNFMNREPNVNAFIDWLLK